MELFAADGHDAGGCERVTGKSGMRPQTMRERTIEAMRAHKGETEPGSEQKNVGAERRRQWITRLVQTMRIPGRNDGHKR